MKVKDAMSAELETITPNSTIKKAAKKMNKYRIGSLIVSTAGFEAVGMITERDILRAFAKGEKPSTKVKDVMTKGLVTIDQNATLEEASDKMVKYGIKRLAATSKGRCVGIVTATDIIIYGARLRNNLMKLMQVPRRLLEAR